MIAERVKAVIAEQFDLDEEEIANELAFEDIGADTLDVAELLDALANEFEVEIPAECADNIETVGDAVNCVKKYMRRGS